MMINYLLIFTFISQASCVAKEIPLCNNTKKILYTKSCCPVIGNKSSKIFHTPGGRFFKRMLKKNKGYDNRKCFKSKSDARKDGYRQSKV